MNIVLLQSVNFSNTALVTSATGSSAHTLRLIEVAPDGAWYVETPRLAGNVVGAGDLATAMYAALQPEAPQHRFAHVAGARGWRQKTRGVRARSVAAADGPLGKMAVYEPRFPCRV